MDDTGRLATDTDPPAAETDRLPVELLLFEPAGGSRLGSRLAAAAREVEPGTSGRITVRTTTSGPFPTRASLTVRAGTHRGSHYLAAPDGPEAAPFRQLLDGLGQPELPPQEQLAAADLMVFIAPGCGNCPHAVAAAVSVVVDNRQVSLTVVDATEHQDLAEEYGVRSVPMTVIDGELSIIGIVPAAQLSAQLSRRAEPDYQRHLLDSLLQSGRFADAAARLCDGRSLQHFAEAWRDSTLETRIQLLLAAEEALAADPAALDGVVTELIAVLATGDRARRGDTADLLGKIGHPDVAAALRTLLDDADAEIVEAAQDALGHLRHRSGKRTTT